jgi:hypothetical protein
LDQREAFKVLWLEYSDIDPSLDVFFSPFCTPHVQDLPICTPTAMAILKEAAASSSKEEALK